MCLWLLTACLGLIPTSPPSANIIVIQGAPTPIIQPTTMRPATGTAVTVRPSSATTRPSSATTRPSSATTSPSSATTRPSSATTRPSSATTSPSSATTRPSSATTRPSSATTRPSSATTRPSSATPGRPTNTASIMTVTTAPITGSLPIDPRLGTTPAVSAALQVPPITGYSAQVPSYETSVRFPREKRSLDSDIMRKVMYNNKNSFTKSHRIVKRQSCACVASGTCATSGTNNGAGNIDIRIVNQGQGQCPAGQVYCCSGTTSQIACGTLQATPSATVVPAAGQANYGEYPWQALILTKQNDYIAGGVLINNLNVLTVTHRLLSYVVAGAAPNVKVRLGEWDAAGTYEPVPYQEYTIQKVFSHPSYNPGTLQYDITVLRLSSAVPFTPAAGSASTINRACLPPNNAATYVGQRCWVSGWGKNMFGTQGQFQQILKEVDVPIVASGPCQTQMRTARLGPNFVLDTTSFICAGGEANKDSCTGDGGSGLVCSVNGQWVVVGLVSWGLGCASANVPAAYVNIAALLPWIKQQVAAA